MSRSTEQEILATLRAKLKQQPSSQLWIEILDLLSQLEGEHLTEALKITKPVVLQWPAELRRISSYTPETDWVKRLFEGDVDARLELVGFADIHYHTNFTEPDLCGSLNFKDDIYPIVKVFAQAIDPNFDPPDSVIDKSSEYTAAAGCGGGYEEEKRGDGTCGFTWYDKIDESPSGTDPSDGDWTPYGMESGFKLSVGRYLRDEGYYKFAIAGPAPKVFELAYAWGMLVRGGKATPELARAILANSRELFQDWQWTESSPPLVTGEKPRRIRSSTDPGVAPLPGKRTEKVKTIAEIVKIAAGIASSDSEVVDRTVSEIFKALEQFRGEDKKYAAALSAISAAYPNEPTIQQFAVNAQKAYDEVMSKVYQKIINPLSGTPCCPSCKSQNIAEVDGMYEFGLMRCGDCGYEEWCDIYQQGDWYV